MADAAEQKSDEKAPAAGRKGEPRERGKSQKRDPTAGSAHRASLMGARPTHTTPIG